MILSIDFSSLGEEVASCSAEDSSPGGSVDPFLVRVLAFPGGDGCPVHDGAGFSGSGPAEAAVGGEGVLLVFGEFTFLHLAQLAARVCVG